MIYKKTENGIEFVFETERERKLLEGLSIQVVNHSQKLFEAEGLRVKGDELMFSANADLGSVTVCPPPSNTPVSCLTGQEKPVKFAGLGEALCLH